MNTTTIIRLKSDNFDCFVSLEAYRVIRLQMSSGDFGAHRARSIEVSPETMERLRWHSGHGFVDLSHQEGPDRVLWSFYDGKGDVDIQCEFND